MKMFTLFIITLITVLLASIVYAETVNIYPTLPEQGTTENFCGGGYHNCVNDTAFPDTTYNRISSVIGMNYYFDNYSTTEISNLGTINNVTLQSYNQPYLLTWAFIVNTLVINGTDYVGATQAFNSQKWYYDTWDTNPATGGDWNFGDFEHMNISHWWGAAAGSIAWNYQFRLVVDYTPTPVSEDDPCNYTSGNFNITTHCELNNEVINVCPNHINITATGQLNLTGTTEINASKVYWQPSDAQESYRLRWEDGTKLRWGEC